VADGRSAGDDASSVIFEFGLIFGAMSQHVSNAPIHQSPSSPSSPIAPIITHIVQYRRLYITGTLQEIEKDQH
jgi:hypothetical protein